MAFTDDQIRAIYLSNRTSRELAEEYEVDQPAITGIWRKDQKRYLRVLEGLPTRPGQVQARKYGKPVVEGWGSRPRVSKSLRPR